MYPNRVFLNDSMFRGTCIFLSIVARGVSLSCDSTLYGYRK